MNKKFELEKIKDYILFLSEKMNLDPYNFVINEDGDVYYNEEKIAKISQGNNNESEHS